VFNGDFMSIAPTLISTRAGKAYGALRKRLVLLKPLAQPITAFGLALVTLLWFCVTQLVWTERNSLERNSEEDTANIALVVEQNVERTSSELDRILKFLRQAYERNGYSADWPQLVKEDFTVDDETVQIAITDKNGMMITSSAMLYPSKPVDLSDREHFLVHAKSNEDKLFISKPVLGRASGKWSVQFTRRYSNADGSFAGVIVISLDPSHLAKTYSTLKLGAGNGLALLGDDGIIRAGSGMYANALGTHYSGTNPAIQRGDTLDTKLTSVREADGHGQVIAARRVAGYPLEVVVTADNSADSTSQRRKEFIYFAGTLAFSLTVLFAMLAIAYRRHRFETEIVKLARHDSLTGLSNRLHFSEILDGAFARGQEERNFALHVIDLDGFKSINDTYGHPIGDCLLLAVAQRLRANLRSTDVLARLGGDEFAVIQSLNNCETDTSWLAARICEVIAQPFQVGRLNLNIGASIGIAFGARDAFTTVDLLRIADLALYSAKEAGRGTFRFFSHDMNEKVVARRDLETGLAKALERRELELFYQPILSIASREVTSYEALLRWRHPERGLVSPAEFIPLAEQTGLIIPIGEWVFRQACDDLAKCPEHLAVSVNCSPLQFKSENLVPSVKSALQKSGLSATRLRIELTESTLMQNDNATLAKIEEFRALGIGVSIDDFGTGFSCLGYLQRYPIDCIKIDRSFVSNLTNRKGGSSIVRAIIALASGLEMSTVAEGVETEEQLAELAQMGCTEVQGFLFSQPRPASEILPTRKRMMNAA
jgi:diguanylate cyclase (GGDEF)-like protein